jgi:hypothetical protein
MTLAAQSGPSASDEAFLYSAEWRLMRAGSARLVWSGGSAQGASLHLETTGFVSKLYKVDNDYSVSYDARFCASSSLLKANEGKRQRETTVTFNRTPGKAELVERDLLNNNKVVSTREVDVPACVHDTIGALGRFRLMKLDPGQTIVMPVSDGKKSASVRVEALKRETVSTPAGKFKAVKFEAHMFNDVIYRRKAHLYFWLTDDARRIPVKIEIDMPFFIGNVTLELEKEEPGARAAAR